MHFDGPKRLPSEQKKCVYAQLSIEWFFDGQSKKWRKREIGAKTVVFRNAGSRR